MPSFVALLRGINVGGRAMIPMSELRELLESRGFTGVRTLLQSGNLLLSGRAMKPSALESQLEKEVAGRFGRPIDFLVREAEEWPEIVAANPFSAEAAADPGHLLVLFLKETPAASALDELKAALRGPEYFRATRRQLYIVYPEGIGRSKLTVSLIEKKLRTRGTGRNWNTVQKIAALLGKV